MRIKLTREEIENLIKILDCHDKDSNWLAKTVPELQHKLEKKLNYSLGNKGKQKYAQEKKEQRLTEIAIHRIKQSDEKIEDKNGNFRHDLVKQKVRELKEIKKPLKEANNEQS